MTKGKERFMYAVYRCGRGGDFRILFNNMRDEHTPIQSPLFDEVSELINLIRPSIQADGGDIELVSVDSDGVVSIRFLGACIGCPSVDMTLQHGIESTLKERIGGISRVLPVE